MAGQGITVEVVQATTGKGRIRCRHRASWHLLVAYEQGARSAEETFADGLPGSTLRDFTRNLTFVPAGHEYVEWHDLNTPARLIFVHFDPAGLQARSASPVAGFVPRLLFDDAALWSTVNKLKGLAESPQTASRPYLEALGSVLVHELARPNPVGALHPDSPIRGGLAAWQQRIVAAYVEEHLAEPIPLATLAQLARLSPYHFSRAFKQSFGVPPHRYHTNRRIERAKALLEKGALSVTDIGLTLGFSETSSFTSAFRKTTGLTPSRYHRTVA
jgi:AraC-like DNA-binding protein